MDRKIRVDIQRITQSKTYETNCNAYTIIRKPNTEEVMVNGYPLSEGEAYEFGGNIGDYYDQGVHIAFGPGGGVQEAFLLRRFEIKL